MIFVDNGRRIDSGGNVEINCGDTHSYDIIFSNDQHFVGFNAGVGIILGQDLMRSLVLM